MRWSENGLEAARAEVTPLVVNVWRYCGATELRGRTVTLLFESATAECVAAAPEDPQLQATLPDLSDTFERHGDALADTDAHGGERALLTGQRQFERGRAG